MIRGKAGGLQIPRWQAFAVEYYGFTLAALALKPSDFCNNGVYGDPYDVNMEDESKKTNLMSLLTVVVSIMGSMALLGYLSIRFLPSDGTAASQANPMATPAMEKRPEGWADDTGALFHQPVKIKYILHRDIQKRIGRSLVTYRGKADGSKIKLDVVVLDLDPDVAYKNIVDISRAKQSFRAGDERFELISAGSLRLRVWHHP